jgi:hypothetical protein
MEVNTGGQRKAAYNIGFAKWRVQCFYDSLVQDSSSVFQLNICAENPPLRKAENRWWPAYLRPFFIGFNTNSDF